MKVTKAEILDIQKRLRKINKCDFKDVEPVGFKITDEFREFVKYVGLNTYDMCLMAIGITAENKEIPEMSSVLSQNLDTLKRALLNAKYSLAETAKIMRAVKKQSEVIGSDLMTACQIIGNFKAWDETDEGWGFWNNVLLKIMEAK